MATRIAHGESRVSVQRETVAPSAIAATTIRAHATARGESRRDRVISRDARWSQSRHDSAAVTADGYVPGLAALAREARAARLAEIRAGFTVVAL